MNVKQFHETARSVLEDGALLFADALDAPPQAEEGMLRLQLAFHGEKQGRLRLACHRAIGEAMARNLLGLADTENCPDELAESSAGELLNILGGSLLAEMAERKGSISMQTPIADVEDAAIRCEHALQSHWSVDGHPLSLVLEWSAG